jgi:hypothetical protein
MDTEKLAPVFLDNQPVNLKEPKPKVSAVLSASGKPETTDVKWLKFQTDKTGQSLRSEEIVDRTADPAKPIYLTSRMDEQESSDEGRSGRSEKGAEREGPREGHEGKGDRDRQGTGRQEDREAQANRPEQAEGRQQEGRPQEGREGGSSRIEPQRRKENR